MNLFEEISRIRQVMGVNKKNNSFKSLLIPATPKSPLNHYSTYKNRESIQKNGLIPKIGKQTTNFINNSGLDLEPIPMVFAMDPRHGNYFGVYGSDIWEIDLTKTNVKWFKDPIHEGDGNNWDFFVSLETIPPTALKLIGSNEQRDDDMDTYRQTGSFPNREPKPVEEPTKEEPSPWSKFNANDFSDEITVNWDEINKEGD